MSARNPLAVAGAALMVALLALAAGLPGAGSDRPGHGQAVNRAAKADRLEPRP
ncbi:hypothetical protein HW532_21480 [Kaustia mangrovi]|uniref:Uncharacterized protein n=1 Tax=Kaustia mangrovi TaxID=2593653 RepID=A0A7S8C7X4_9HYPH|nr:hypothetical protein [Kaustia mangrovi]QPC45039.1 hypothetical protein HW532_21480 [Kaustia mangrovi]